MSGIFILIAVVLGIVLVIGAWVYGKQSKRGPGKVKPDAQPTPREEEKQEPRSGF